MSVESKSNELDYELWKSPGKDGNPNSHVEVNLFEMELDECFVFMDLPRDKTILRQIFTDLYTNKYRLRLKQDLIDEIWGDDQYINESDPENILRVNTKTLRSRMEQSSTQLYNVRGHALVMAEKKTSGTFILERPELPTLDESYDDVTHKFKEYSVTKGGLSLSPKVLFSSVKLFEVLSKNPQDYLLRDRIIHQLKRDGLNLNYDSLERSLGVLRTHLPEKYEILAYDSLGNFAKGLRLVVQDS